MMRLTGAFLTSATDRGQSLSVRILPASESATSVVVNTLEEPVSTNCPLRRLVSTTLLIARASFLDRWASSMISGSPFKFSIKLVSCPSGSASMAAKTAASSNVMKRPLPNKSRTSVVLPTCLGPMRLTTRADASASSSSGMRCLGRYLSVSVMNLWSLSRLMKPKPKKRSASLLQNAY